MSFTQKSYLAHQEHYDRAAESSASEQANCRNWMRTDTVDYWRHERFYRLLDPFLRAYPGARWLTVGDGKYGRDAHYIETHGGRAVATDISNRFLREAQACGFIREGRAENAESLSFADGDFDFVYCKESFHHFPRPGLALYEMLRVARKAVIFFEPRDLHGSWQARATGLVKRLLGRDRALIDYEPSGNYIYRLSEHELTKAALALNLPAVAFCGANDLYLAGTEEEVAARNPPSLRRIRLGIALQDALCALGLLRPLHLCATLFHEEPGDTLCRTLSLAHYSVRMLPRNPFATSTGAEN